MAENLWNNDRKIQIDRLSVLEQVGLLAPEMIEYYVVDFLGLIFGKDNRLIWAETINLALIAEKNQVRFRTADRSALLGKRLRADRNTDAAFLRNP